jgi:protocatechuate 3,4-dioxygenase beta subunit
MTSSSDLISRRSAVFQTLAFAGGMSLLPGLQRAVAAEPEFTPENALGPFYPIQKPLDKDSDLTRLRGRKGVAKGQIIYVTGRILNLKGDPVRGAALEMWQANSVGRYAHPGDENQAAELDPNFQGYAVLKTNRDGEYRFKTIKPGAYPATPGWERPPHLHFDIRSRSSRLISQMFFPGEPLNEKDQLFTSLGPQAKFAIATVETATREIEDGALQYRWDIILFEK